MIPLPLPPLLDALGLIPNVHAAAFGRIKSYVAARPLDLLAAVDMLKAGNLEPLYPSDLPPPRDQYRSMKWPDEELQAVWALVGSRWSIRRRPAHAPGKALVVATVPAASLAQLAADIQQTQQNLAKLTPAVQSALAQHNAAGQQLARSSLNEQEWTKLYQGEWTPAEPAAAPEPQYTTITAIDWAKADTPSATTYAAPDAVPPGLSLEQLKALAHGMGKAMGDAGPDAYAVGSTISMNSQIAILAELLHETTGYLKATLASVNGDGMPLVERVDRLYTRVRERAASNEPPPPPPRPARAGDLWWRADGRCALCIEAGVGWIDIGRLDPAAPPASPTPALPPSRFSLIDLDDEDTP